MKPAHAIGPLLALAASVGLWLLFRTNEDDAPPPGPGSGDATRHAHSSRADGAAERTQVAGEAPKATQPGPPDPAAPAPQQPPPATPAPTPNLVLQVHALATKAPVAAFRWRVRSADGTQRGDGADGRAELVLAADRRVELLVEAEGFAPFAQADLAAPAAGLPPLQVDVFLAAAGLATGITLQVHDTALRPIAQARVDAHTLRPEDRDTAWHLGKPLWTRRTGAADGRYLLPELPPGEYGIRVFAVDEAGALLPMLPFVRTFTLTGSNGFVEDVTLEPGCLPVFEFVDGAGHALDPANGAVTLSLRLPGGPAVRRQWQQKRAGKLVGAEDELPGPGPCWPAEPVAAGAWSLEVAVDGKTRSQQQVVLRAGERQTERIVVP